MKRRHSRSPPSDHHRNQRPRHPPPYEYRPQLGHLYHDPPPQEQSSAAANPLQNQPLPGDFNSGSRITRDFLGGSSLSRPTSSRAATFDTTLTLQPPRPPQYTVDTTLTLQPPPLPPRPVYYPYPVALYNGQPWQLDQPRPAVNPPLQQPHFLPIPQNQETHHPRPTYLGNLYPRQPGQVPVRAAMDLPQRPLFHRNRQHGVYGLRVLPPPPRPLQLQPNLYIQNQGPQHRGHHNPLPFNLSQQIRSILTSLFPPAGINYRGAGPRNQRPAFTGGASSSRNPSRRRHEDQDKRRGR